MRARGGELGGGLWTKRGRWGAARARRRTLALTLAGGGRGTREALDREGARCGWAGSPRGSRAPARSRLWVAHGAVRSLYSLLEAS